MSDTLTFANYSPLEHGPEGIYLIGANPDSGSGVLTEIAQAFGHELSAIPEEANLGELISKVGPAKELQENIEQVQAILGTEQDAVGIARDWVERSGLLTPVERSFANGNETRRTGYEVAFITGGVRNWMQRRAQIASDHLPSWNVMLVAGNRPMKTTEGPDVVEGMTESDYMREVIQPSLDSHVVTTRLVAVGSGSGNEVVAAGASDFADRADLADPRISAIVVSNAGAWVQNAGQFRRALRAIEPGFDAGGRQFSVISDGFELGTGAEPTSTHQNPFSALGQIARNTQELTRQP